VNDVNPGFTDTIRDPSTHSFLIGDENRRKVESRIPIGRATTLEELAFVCAFLCSDRAMCITGSVIHADGGMSMLG